MKAVWEGATQARSLPRPQASEASREVRLAETLIKLGGNMGSRSNYQNVLNRVNLFLFEISSK
jgi:hypothetical protein